MNTHVARIIFNVAIALAPAALVFSQTSQSAKPRFEVASIKRSTDPARIGLRPTGDRFVAQSMRLRDLLQFAYSPCDGQALLESQISGAPGWADSDRFDIEAKPESFVPRCQMQLMVQSLLEDRFQLKAQFETREGPVYQLVVVKPGRMKTAEDQSALPPSTTPTRLDLIQLPARGSWVIRSGPPVTSLVGTAMPMSRLLIALAGTTPELRDRPLIDKTNLTGLFDVQLQFAVVDPKAAPPGQVPPDAPSDPTLFTAIQEQLGLKVESVRGPIDVLVIQSVQKPSEN